MRNLILGILIGIGGSWLFVSETPVGWLVWLLFAVGSVLVVFGLDVLVGSLKEHEERAAWLGLSMFGGSGAVALAVAFSLVV
jgi:hypothetical protein